MKKNELKDQIYILKDNKLKPEHIEIPVYGEVTFKIRNGKITNYDVLSQNKLD